MVLQRVLLADAAIHNVHTGTGASLPNLLPISSTSPTGYVPSENIVPISSPAVSNAVLSVFAESIALSFSPIPSVSSGVAASAPMFDNTSAPYISANKSPNNSASHGLQSQNPNTGPHAGSVPISRHPLNNEA
jgi:hypothetical protein